MDEHAICDISSLNSLGYFKQIWDAIIPHFIKGRVDGTSVSFGEFHSVSNIAKSIAKWSQVILVKSLYDIALCRHVKYKQLTA